MPAVVLYCKIKNVLFFAFNTLCEKCYKPITVQYYIADCVSWVPRLTLLDLRTNWTYKHTLRMELVRMVGTYWTVISSGLLKFNPSCMVTGIMEIGKWVFRKLYYLHRENT